MKRGQRVISVILALVMCLTLMPVSSLAMELAELNILKDEVCGRRDGGGCKRIHRH